MKRKIIKERSGNFRNYVKKKKSVQQELTKKTC